MIFAKLSGGKTIGIGFQHKTLKESVDLELGVELEFRHTLCNLFEVPVGYTGLKPKERLEKGLVPKVLAVGSARCSLQDNYKKEIGRKLALTRALEETSLDKHDRNVVWRAYLNRAQAVQPGTTIH